MNNSTKWETFLVCFVVTAGIVYLRLIANYPAEVILIIDGMLGMVEAVIVAFGLSYFIEYIQSIPPFVILLVTSGIQVLFGLLFMRIFKNFMEQGSILILKKSSDVIKSGLVIYVCCGVVIAIFMYSIVGMPVAVFVGISAHIVSSVGRIPMAIYTGYVVEGLLGVKGHTYTYYLFGSFILMLCESVFGVGIAFLFFIIPVISLGVVFTMWINRYVLRIHYDTEFLSKTVKENFDRDKIRDIINKGFDNEENKN